MELKLLIQMALEHLEAGDAPAARRTLAHALEGIGMFLPPADHEALDPRTRRRNSYRTRVAYDWIEQAHNGLGADAMDYQRALAPVALRTALGLL